MHFTIITGASKGIGKSFAKLCAAKKMNLILVARSADLLETLAAELQHLHGIAVHLFACDLLDPSAGHRLFDWIAANNFRVNMLINNAGIGHLGRFDTQPINKHIDVMHLNMDVMVKLCYEFLQRSDTNSRRYILNTVSMGAYLPIPYMAIYAASKSFMLSFTHALRHELRHENVYLTALCPAGVDTAFFEPANMTEVATRTANMMAHPDAVAAAGMKGLLKNKAVVIPGMMNVAASKLLNFVPVSVATGQIGKVYQPQKK